ncbi:MAG: ester cyclase [Thermoleophilia bacterium]
MSIEDNKVLARRYLEEVYSRGNLEVIDECLDRDIQDHEEFGDQMPAGLVGVRELVKAFRAAFPDISVTIDDLVAEGDRVFIRASWVGTHKGEFMGISPTGKRIYFSSMDEIRVGDDRIKEHWRITDTI